jgi:oxygen-dependent protoporphyrinogen oxidase
MREMEKDYGSLFIATIGRALAARRNGTNHAKPRFITLKQGAQEMVDVLVEQLSGNLQLNAKVKKIEKSRKQYLLTLSNDETILADAIILTTPANIASNLLKKVTPQSAKAMAEIRHVNIGTISLAYKDEEMPSDLKINGLMVPRREKRRIDAVTFTSRKLNMRAPKDYTLIRVFFGGASPETVTLNDQTLLKTVQNELKEILGIQATPIETVVFRWPESFPQADVGHIDRYEQIKGQLPPGIHLAGSSYLGIGVPDCIRQGRKAALASINDLSKSVGQKG